MATDVWLEYNGVELVNLARTAVLADVMGIDAVWADRGSLGWVGDNLGVADYSDITLAPWYNAAIPASAEFAGIVPMGFPGLDDSTTESSTTEYLTSGGRSALQRNTTLSIVASVALVGTTDRGVEYGKRWMDQTLRNLGARTFCSGVELRYFRYPGAGAPQAHRRNVRLTRGATVTRKRSTDCSVVWMSTFTLSADDPFEYGDPIPVITRIGGGTTTGNIISSGMMRMTQQGCPEYDYTPVYDPEYPALVPSPSAPEIYSAGWNIEDGMDFYRRWARIYVDDLPAPGVVPVFSFTAADEIRRVRLSIWPSTSAPDDQCDPLFTAIVNYSPGGDQTFYVDGEQEASYVWDGFSDMVRRTDSLVFGPNGVPVEWSLIADPEGVIVTLDAFYLPNGTLEGAGTLKAQLSLVPKSS